MLKRSKTNNIGIYVFVVIVGMVMVFPLIWMFFAAFKSNAEIFGAFKILPESWSIEAFVNGWQGVGKYTYTTYFINTFSIVLPTTLLTVCSCALVAYGFARFNFRLKRVLFVILIATLMLPNTVIIIPRYTLFNSLDWLNTYLPFYVPALLACYPFFIFMLLQFMRGLPHELDESAHIDGCGTFKTFLLILLPLMKPALFSAGLFQFLWTYNDFFNSLIFINSVEKYPISLALRSAIDVDANVQWSQVMAMAVVSVVPLIIMFFAAQKYFVEGIATSGLKG